MNNLETYNEFRNEVDMLQGNIARICQTKETEELLKMGDWAKLRLDRMLEYRKKQLSKISCSNCANYQAYEPGAGLNSGCLADELYTDEDCQEIIPAVNDEIIKYFLNSGSDCPYFKKVM